MDWAGPSVLPQKRQQQLPKDSANVLSYAQWGAHPGSRASAAETRAETDEGDSLQGSFRSVLQSETGVQRCAAMMVEHSDPGLPGFSSLRTRRSTFGAPLPVLRSWRPKMNVERPGIWGQSQPNKPTTNKRPGMGESVVWWVDGW